MPVSNMGPVFLIPRLFNVDGALDSSVQEQESQSIQCFAVFLIDEGKG